MIDIIMEYLQSGDTNDQYYSIKILGSLFSSSNTEIIDLFLKKDILEQFYKILTQEGTNDQNTVYLLWVISNITAGTQNQIEAFADHQSLLSLIFLLMKSEIK